MPHDHNVVIRMVLFGSGQTQAMARLAFLDCPSGCPQALADLIDRANALHVEHPRTQAEIASARAATSDNSPVSVGDGWPGPGMLQQRPDVAQVELDMPLADMR